MTDNTQKAQGGGAREAYRIANMHMLAVGASLTTVDERAHYVQRLADEISTLSQPPEASEVEAVAWLYEKAGHQSLQFSRQPHLTRPSSGWTGTALGCIAHPPKASPMQDAPTFKRGDRVEKISGAKWRGTVVGEYSTALTPEGYAVESETETGSVQIYPVKALSLALAQPAPEQGEG